MAATMIVGALAACTYAVLIALHVAAIRHDRGVAGANRPRVARWLAASGERRRARRESNAVQRRIDGELDKAAYQVTMAQIAAQDAIERPLQVPKSLL
ncbi:hypothetical protein ACQP00_19610 [Dactylosporangium sp. CS-047395]|uniref:hypothetical protein n=1 Tax=Dactylosporangium sp. CS-047395 TaxID=3239936 RepID=UPI003D89FC89